MQLLMLGDGGERESGFEMQIAHCVQAGRRKSSQYFNAKQMIPFHKDNPDIPLYFSFEMQKGCL